MKSLLISILLFAISLADNPQFSQTPIKLNKYDGLDRRLGVSEFVDLDNDNDLDVVFMRDFEGPDYPVYYQNIGTDSVPQYVRDETMFAWLDAQYSRWDLLDLRMLDFDHDSDFDLIVFTVNSSIIPRSVLYENIGNSNSANWNVVGDTVFYDLGGIREINISNVLGDSLPQITVIGDSVVKFYRQQNDSLIELPNYFSPIQSMSWGYNNGPTKIEFFKLPQDTSQYLIVNREYYDMYISYYYQRFEIYKNTSSKLAPYWQLQTRKSGHCRVLKHINTIIPDKYCYSDGFWSFSILFNDLQVDQTRIEFQNPALWINGNTTDYRDLSSFDWKGNGLQDLIISTNNLWQEVGGWGIDSNFNMFLCVPDFQLDSSRTNYSFDFNFPLNVFENNDPSSLYFDFADLDADNDHDMMILKTNVSYAGDPPFLRIYWNTGSDNFPVWDTCETINFDHYRWDKSVTLEDMDNDGDFDMIINKLFSQWQNNCIAFYENIGTLFDPHFSSSADTLIKKSYAHPEFADLDGDGDKDMIVQYDTTISSRWTSRYVYYQNDSNDTNFVFTRIDSILPVIDNVSAPHLVDIDNDTDYDLFLLTNSGEIYFVENLTATGFPGFSVQSPNKYKLFQNYPNPFNSQTNIKYYLPKTGNVKIEIFNILGQKVIMLINQTQKIGEHQVIWDGRDKNNNFVSSGIYIYNLSSGKYTTNKKLLILK